MATISFQCRSGAEIGCSSAFREARSPAWAVAFARGQRSIAPVVKVFLAIVRAKCGRACPRCIGGAQREAEVPFGLGVPEMTPVVVLTESPPGKPAALKLVGLLRRNGLTERYADRAAGPQWLVTTGACCTCPIVRASVAEPVPAAL